ncbi:hypothetical protein VNI00_006918 [Paramarasmius palmivorus]|uniref:Uncharacterized protein n=1 Tax=Paramarasmius palmivorus TaxID=297713 RepID=A0AAW0D4V6_9AGAR
MPEDSESTSTLRHGSQHVATELRHSTVPTSSSLGTECATPLLADSRSESDPSAPRFQSKAEATNGTLVEAQRQRIHALEAMLKYLEIEVAVTKGKNTQLQNQNIVLQQKNEAFRKQNHSLIIENDALKEILNFLPSSDEELQDHEPGVPEEFDEHSDDGNSEDDTDLDYGSTLSESIFETLLRNPGEFI